MNCRKCEKPLGDEYKLVAEWPFCLDCFEQLLNPPPAPAAVAQPAPDPAPPAAAPVADAAPRCFVCQRAIDEEDAARLGPWRFCRSCFAALTAARAEPAEDPGVAEEPAAHSGPRDLYEQGHAQRVVCAACGRRIPGGGARVIDGAPLCPECARRANEG